MVMKKDLVLSDLLYVVPYKLGCHSSGYGLLFEYDIVQIIMIWSDCLWLGDHAHLFGTCKSISAMIQMDLSFLTALPFKTQIKKRAGS